ncbi:hypothetical protein EEB12_26720 [Rhodococcus sp. WS1]|uniref:hypothetical protein n=1 Tax=unclassified Rhodococcus (in: high G+C Gram-positive bacteria) TaxID=192944 RepID=UPI0011444F2D|nr:MULTISPECIES: hypothetical protein [unclassified Rhodococcus (in: high G+C Gram-positive bacteria)]ROZ53524.1 hypothetical protein EEB12_26720 [Rhodococcus sp. WS1]TQC36770.1 hypothetical protein EEB16_16705 [Rhodococcus sp. WS7]
MTTWFLCPSVDPSTADDLRALGIVLGEQQDRAVYYRSDDGLLMKEIGSIAVYDSGNIHAWPFEDTSPKELARLLGAAEVSFRSAEKMYKATGWKRVRNARASYWYSVIAIRVDSRDEVAMAIRAATDFERVQYASRLKRMTEQAPLIEHEQVA